jgi:hypothetical protein
MLTIDWQLDTLEGKPINWGDSVVWAFLSHALLEAVHSIIVDVMTVKKKKDKWNYVVLHYASSF